MFAKTVNIIKNISFVVSMVLFVFILGVRQFIIMYLIVFEVTIVSSIIPINKISKMKPI